MKEGQLEKAFDLFSQNSKQLEEAYLSLQKEWQKKSNFESILRHMNEGVIFVSKEGICTLFNEASSTFFGISPKQILGQRFSNFFSDDFFGFSLSKMPKKINRLIHLTLDCEKQIEVSATTIDAGILFVLHDVTEIQRLKETVLQNEKLKEMGRLAAFLAHEIQNPIAAISGIASLIALDFEKDSKHYEMAQKIIEGASQLNLLVTNILDYSRPLNLHFEGCNLDTLIEDLFSLYRFNFEKGAGPYSITCDKSLFRCVLSNLIKNAIEASQTTVDVQLFEKKGYYCIAIKDQGVGIPKENLDKIFTPFFTTKKGGHGLGLSESYKIIKAHGGELEVASQMEKGSTFTIKMPCTSKTF